MKWFKTKTNKLAIAAILTAAGAYLSGNIELVPAIQSAVAALLAIFMRQGVEKSGK